MTSIGFTGTRDGMTISQMESVEVILKHYFDKRGPHEWHDGDCIGADDQAHRLVEKICRELYPASPLQLHGHPCNLSDKLKAFNEFNVLHPTLPPLVRNRVMVDSSDAYIATPKEYDEVSTGSGTWATIRYARATGAKLHTRLTSLTIIWPDGTMSGTSYAKSSTDSLR